MPGYEDSRTVYESKFFVCSSHDRTKENRKFLFITRCTKMKHCVAITSSMMGDIYGRVENLKIIASTVTCEEIRCHCVTNLPALTQVRMEDCTEQAKARINSRFDALYRQVEPGWFQPHVCLICDKMLKQKQLELLSTYKLRKCSRTF
jgi:hypothetical protein